MGLFDQLFTGTWDETSSCGFNKRCKEIKAHVNAHCIPMRSTYGENMYRSCVQMSQAQNAQDRPYSVEDVVCQTPLEAFELYGIRCEGLDKRDEQKGKLLGLTLPIWASLLVLAIIFFLLKNR